ncbi:Transposon Ty3-G Gag-Pol polyprotein [Frankliniella fusca]|uniref:Transposon Ty3-G Gag-Pol polyprotein n=1 Tax=Frankliniella fusca TaxID=407009 RepID=A0AAE1LHH0_9NEOP|nr:Transposon Ty3-G Gag-Pol polyprotein [Frankliniella fusca]
MFIPPSLSPKIRAINKPDCDKPNSDNPDFDNPKSVEPNSVTTQDETSNFIEANQDLFEGFGTFPDIVTLMIDKKVQPTRKPPRRLPAVISTKLQDALKKSEEASIIEKCEMPETWVSNMLIREKSDGSLRICLDPKDLNEAIQRPFFEIPTAQHIQTKLSDNAVFTVLDLKDRFWHCKRGRSINPDRVQAIQVLTSPTNKMQLQKILGKFNSTLPTNKRLSF